MFGLEHVLDALLEVVLDASSRGAERAPTMPPRRRPAGRAEQKSSPIRTPQNRPLKLPSHACGRRGDMKLPLVVAPDDGGVFEVER